MSLLSTVWTADRFCRKTEGNEAGFVVVVMVFDAVSESVLEIIPLNAAKYLIAYLYFLRRNNRRPK